MAFTPGTEAHAGAKSSYTGNEHHFAGASAGMPHFDGSDPIQASAKKQMMAKGRFTEQQCENAIGRQVANHTLRG